MTSSSISIVKNEVRQGEVEWVVSQSSRVSPSKRPKKFYSRMGMNRSITKIQEWIIHCKREARTNSIATGMSRKQEEISAQNIYSYWCTRYRYMICKRIPYIQSMTLAIIPSHLLYSTVLLIKTEDRISNLRRRKTVQEEEEEDPYFILQPHLVIDIS